MHNPFDHLAKTVGKEALAHWEQWERRRRKEKRGSLDPVTPPFLWILAATVSAPVLEKLGARPAPSFPPGVYLVGDDLLRVGVVVASELPRHRSTLLVRIMAAGPGLAAAIAELGALPDDAPERSAAEGVVVELQGVLGKKQDRTPEEEEFIMSVQTTWAKAKELGRDEGRALGRDEGRALGRDEGRALGRAEEAARAVLTVLRVRDVAVPAAANERILAQKDPERLERWLEKAAIVKAVDDVFDEPS